MAPTEADSRSHRLGPRGRLLAGIGLAAAVIVTAVSIGLATTGGANTASRNDFTSVGCGTYSGRGCARPSRRIDLTRPSFSNPTKFTNPLFPISTLS